MAEQRNLAKACGSNTEGSRPEGGQIMLRYPVALKKDSNGTLLVTAPDFPELTTFGADRADALARAEDAIATVIQGRISDRAKIPKPSAARRGHFHVNLST